MTDEQRPAETEEPSDGMAPVVALPRWVPVLLGSVLVLMAGFAVYTGLTYRSKPLSRALRRPIAATQRVVSRVLPGDTVDDPAPNPARPDTSSKTVISGDAAGVRTATLLRVRRGMLLHIEPKSATVYVNDRPVGTAGQFSRADSAYEFPEEGSFTVRIMADGYEDSAYLVTVDPEAGQETEEIRQKLKARRR